MLSIQDHLFPSQILLKATDSTNQDEEERTFYASSWGLFTNDVMPQKGGDPAAELCQEALMWSMVLDEVILNLEG